MSEKRTGGAQPGAERLGDKRPRVKGGTISTLHSIRTRLLIAFVLLVLLPAAAINVFSAVNGFRSGQEQVMNQLELVADFKELEIDAWKDRLRVNLDAALREGSTLVYAQRALEAAQGEIGFLFKRPLEQSLHLYNYQTRHFDELFLLNLDGRKIATSGFVEEYYLRPETPDVIVKQDFHGDEAYFKRGLEESYQVLYSPVEGEWGGLALQPVLDARRNVIGVLAGYVGLDELREIMQEETGLGETVKTYLVGRDYVLLTSPEPGGEKEAYARSPGIDAVMGKRISISGMFEDYRRVPVVGVYRWLPDLEVMLVAEQEQAEAFRSIYATLAGNSGVALLCVLLAVGASLLVARGIAHPLTNLTETATQIAAGDLERTAKVEREDEIGALARAFNSMTTQLREMIGNLEQRVAERTHELERRSAYLQASAEVGQAASSILDTDRLVREVVELIRERFGLYYVGLFLLDVTGKWAVLRAGTGEAGRVMLARGHRIKVGEGMVGWSIANAQARIALDVGEDVVRLATAELPETRSEAALPMRSRGKVIGALTVQSDQPAAFGEDTITALQIMADQVAVALDNARLFAEGQEALEAMRRAYGELSSEAWVGLLRARPDLAYRSDERDVTRAEDVWWPEMEQALREGRSVQGDGRGIKDGLPLAVPIKVRDKVIGVLGTYKYTGDWTPAEVTLLEMLADQLGQALESARLYQETQRRAARERLIGEITDRMRRTTNVERIVQTAVDELFSTLGTSRVFVRLGVAPSSPDEEQNDD